MASGERVEINVHGRPLSVQIEGLTEIEIVPLVRRLTDLMKDIEEQTKTADSGKLAILAALHALAELSQLQMRQKELRLSESNQLDNAIASLDSALKTEP